MTAVLLRHQWRLACSGHEQPCSRSMSLFHVMLSDYIYAHDGALTDFANDGGMRVAQGLQFLDALARAVRRYAGQQAAAWCVRMVLTLRTV